MDDMLVNAMIEALVEDDFETIFNKPTGMSYLSDILGTFYDTMSPSEILAEIKERGIVSVDVNLNAEEG